MPQPEKKLRTDVLALELFFFILSMIGILTGNFYAATAFGLMFLITFLITDQWEVM